MTPQAINVVIIESSQLCFCLRLHSYTIQYHTFPQFPPVAPYPYHTNTLYCPLSGSPPKPPRPSEKAQSQGKKKRKKKNPLQGDFLRVWFSASHNCPPHSVLSLLSDFFHLDDFAQSIPLVFRALIGCVVGELDSMLRDELLRSKDDEIAYVLNFAGFFGFLCVDSCSFCLAVSSVC